MPSLGLPSSHSSGQQCQSPSNASVADGRSRRRKPIRRRLPKQDASSFQAQLDSLDIHGLSLQGILDLSGLDSRDGGSYDATELQSRERYIDRGFDVRQGIAVLDEFSSQEENSGDEENLPCSAHDAQEEAERELENAIIDVITSGDWQAKLRPNSGQSCSMKNSNLCVYFTEEEDRAHRVWEWHGHMQVEHPEGGLDLRYVYSHYYELLQEDVETSSLDSSD